LVDKVQMQYFTDEEELRRIRYLHFQIKHLEEALEKNEEDIELGQLNYVLEYTRILNLNYGKAAHKPILDKLEITQTYHDPVDDKDIEVNDLMFECARVLWVLARAYKFFSEKFEDKEEWENAIVAMVECSKMYKTAAYFSAASIYQHEIGEALSSTNLELKSEEARIIAQGIAAHEEESKDNLYFSSKLYAGLSALSKRLFYLRKHNEKKKQQIRAQFHYDMGRACILKAQALEASSITSIKQEKILKLKQKADFYFKKAKRIWNSMKESLKTISKEEQQIIDDNIAIVDEDIEQNPVESLEYEEIKKIQDPEPIVIIPENLAPFVPKSTVYLTQFVPKDVNKQRFREFKKKKLEKKIPYNKKEKLLDKKAGILRTINELKVLKKQNEIDLEKFAELMEKYSRKVEMIDRALEKLARI